MKRSRVLKVAPVQPKQEGDVLSVQAVEEILILNYWKDKELIGRYCMNTETGEYETYFKTEGIWRQTKLQTLCGYDAVYFWQHDLDGHIPINSDAEGKLIKELLPEEFSAMEPLVRIIRREEKYSTTQRENKEERRTGRIESLMNKVPPLPKDFEAWILRVAARDQDYAFYDKNSERWSCTACGRMGTATMFKREDGKRARHNDQTTCPFCGKKIQAKTRTNRIRLVTNAVVLQNIDSDRAVARHFDLEIHWEGQKRIVQTSEAVRIILLRKHKKYACDIFYNQCNKDYGWRYSWDTAGCYDHKNPSNRRINEEYLHPEGIEAALEGTAYEAWKRIFGQLAEAGKKLEYNRMMAAQNDRGMIAVIEYLFKGRFDRLLRETVGHISCWINGYYGPLSKDGETIEEVFGLYDRQKINRIRACDGGEEILKWMQWSEKTGRKISQETLEWLTSENVSIRHLTFISAHMSPQQIMNYVKRQRMEGYAGKSTRAVLEQWEDYISMCGQLGKNVKDEMVYRPRELKRRHDEAVEVIRKQRILEQMKRDQKANQEAARKMREKYPGAEEVLKEIREKYEYQNDDYVVIVPRCLMDIVAEGNALHHCAGSSERYFERLMQRETYICFLRRASEPKVPYYTIEVEPSGTIRQHRSYYDEEPGIEEIRGFLKEWQKVIRKRLTEEDHELGRESAVKRQKNIEELIEKNNTRVLKGLEEDFMEAV